MDDWKVNIKKSLEDREIKPSIESWDRLETMLDKHDKPFQSNRKWIWLSIAASLTLLISIGAISLLSDKNVPYPIAKKPTVQKNIDKEFIAPNIQKNILTKDEMNEHLVQEEKENLNINITSSTNNLYEKNNTDIIKKRSIDSINVAITPPTPQVDTTLILNTQSPEDYLAQAMKKLKDDSLNNETLYVNDKALLNHVEDEVFEEKSPDILNRVTNQIKELQAAISQRNKEQ